MANAEKFTPKDSNQNSNAGCVHGSGLNEGGAVPPKVMLGSRQAVIDNVPPSGKQIFVAIPPRNPQDPSAVTVRVFTTVNGQEREATYPNGALKFSYTPSGSAPAISSPPSPQIIPIGVKFDLTLIGSSFVLPTRQPTAVYAVSQNINPPLVGTSRALVADPAGDRIVATFDKDPDRPGNPVGLPEGEYQIFVEFSDNAAADSDGDHIYVQD
jgi:hypothetical protein